MRALSNMHQGEEIWHCGFFPLSEAELHCHWLEIRQNLALSFTAFAQGRSHGVQAVFHWSDGSCWKGRSTQGCLWRVRWGDLPCMAPVSRDLAQPICSDEAFLCSSAEEVETNQGIWVKCLLVKWLNTPNVRSFSCSQKEDSDIQRVEEVDF